MKKLIESIPFTPEKWGDEDMPEDFPAIVINVYKEDNDHLTLVLDVNGETAQWMMNVCPHHYREQVSYFWNGLEQGYDLANDNL